MISEKVQENAFVDASKEAKENGDCRRADFPFDNTYTQD
jgi:hypothetical protein